MLFWYINPRYFSVATARSQHQLRQVAGPGGRTALATSPWTRCPGCPKLMDFPCWLLGSSTDPSYGHPKMLRVPTEITMLSGDVEKIGDGWNGLFFGFQPLTGIEMDLVGRSRSLVQIWSALFHSASSTRARGGPMVGLIICHIDHAEIIWFIIQSIPHYLFHDACSSFGLLNLDPKTSPKPSGAQFESKIMWFVRCPKSSEETSGNLSSLTSFHWQNSCQNILRHPQILILKMFLNSGKKKHRWIHCTSSASVRQVHKARDARGILHQAFKSFWGLPCNNWQVLASKCVFGLLYLVLFLILESHVLTTTLW